MNLLTGVLTSRLFCSLIELGMALSLASPSFAEERAALNGPRVRVVAPSVEKHDIVGQLVGDDDASLTIARVNSKGAAAKTVVPLVAVTRVEVSRASSKKGKGALIGAAAGLAVSITLGLTTGDTNCSGKWLCFNQEETSIIWSVLTVPTGTLVGLLVAPGEKWEVVDPRRLHVVVGPTRGGGQIRFALSF